MFWADRIAGEIEERYGTSGKLVVRDEKTVSGRVHVGSMRGVAIHGTVSEALAQRGVENVFLYELNDFDPMDDIPTYLPREQFEKYLGMPLRDIPSPEPGYTSFAEYFANDFRGVIEESGWRPEFYWSSDLYFGGKMDGVIRSALERAADIRRIYKEVSGSVRAESWLPINVICPQCGKMTTTEASDFDGETVQVQCLPEKVAYTKGCGFTGRVSPFGGKAKLAWKADWPAKWKVKEVKVEGGGKDHSTRGGSRDVGNHISREVFGYEPPFDIPYEFFLVGGKKMSSSKGRGSSAREISELVPAKILRLALLSKDINQAFNFDPEGDTIPNLYDLHDKLAESYKAGVEDDYRRLYLFIHPANERERIQVPFLPRFSQIAYLVQMPHLNIEDEAAAMKGAPLTDEDRGELAERAHYAQVWLERYAPEKFVFKIQETLPEAARGLSDIQEKAMRALSEYIAAHERMPSGEDLHKKLHEMKEEQGIAPAELFSAIYLLFLGKPQGPKAGWFLSVLDRDFVLKRLQDASR